MARIIASDDVYFDALRMESLVRQISAWVETLPYSELETSAVQSRTIIFNLCLQRKFAEGPKSGNAQGDEVAVEI